MGALIPKNKTKVSQIHLLSECVASGPAQALSNSSFYYRGALNYVFLIFSKVLSIVITKIP